MACTKCGNKRSNCGCKDSAYTTVKTYTCPADEACPTPSPCSEYVDTRCTFQNGFGIWDMGIEDGRSLQSIIQQMIIRTGSTPDCADPCSDCQSTWNLYTIGQTSTTIAIEWSASATAESYQVEYQPVPVDGCTLGVWTLLTSQTTLTANIGSLTANTEYLIRVNAVCGEAGNCYSVIIRVSTEA